MKHEQVEKFINKNKLDMKCPNCGDEADIDG